MELLEVQSLQTELHSSQCQRAPTTQSGQLCDESSHDQSPLLPIQVPPSPSPPLSKPSPHSFTTFLLRHGQSEYNVVGRIGGDSSLTYHGVQYARRLASYVEHELKRNQAGEPVPARLWTSTMKRTVQSCVTIEMTCVCISQQ
jgi:hypothetical protein